MKNLIELVKDAMKALYEEESILFKNNVSERCLVYNFAKQFVKLLNSREYEQLNVDLEYNRNCNGMKTIGNQLTSYPDLVLHKRGSNIDNKMVIEFKKWNNQTKLNNDREKLKCFKIEYGYEICMLIIFDEENYEKVKYEEI